MNDHVILFCDCRANREQPEWKAVAGMLDTVRHSRIVTLSDLCGICAGKDPELKTLAGEARQILLVACRRRTVNLILHYYGIGHTNNIRLFNLLEDDLSLFGTVLAEFEQAAPERVSGNGTETGDPASTTGNPLNQVLDQHDPSWPSWYPVIDETRCNGCGQCADFCLFGVYRKDSGRVGVVQPRNCKNNCPACARICPRVAIVFPKFTGGGAIGGSDRVDETAELQRLQKDTETILGSDIYQTLEQRKRKRQSILREEALNTAEKERIQALREAGTGPE
ncbi:MAG TPA: 4Fe-4S binding protein [Bacteroidales bacterium]|nr:4Fe-4S binding protein [Bacteroidales bacterium]